MDEQEAEAALAERRYLTKADWDKIRPFTPEEAAAFIESAPWTFAKTAAFMPHEYVIKEWRDVGALAFVRFWALIRAGGYRAKWTAPVDVDYGNAGKTFTNDYLDIGEFAYWVIPFRVLNREHRDVQTPPFKQGRRVRLPVQETLIP